MRAMLVAVLAASFGFSLQAQFDNGIKSVVHEAVVTKYEVEYYAIPVVEGLRRYRYTTNEYRQKVTELLNENLEERVKRQLILRDFKTGGYNLPDPIIEGAVEEQIRTRWGGREKLMKSLQAQGMSYEKFRQQIKENIIISALRGKNISQEIVVSPHRIEASYLANQDKYKVNEEVKLRVIVLNIPTEADAVRVRQRAEEIRTKVKEGAAFSEMAKVYSQGKQGEQGGDWGWIQRFDVDGAPVLRKELGDPAFSLKPGEVSDVIEIGDKCYLLFVEDKRAAHTKPLAEVRAAVEDTLLQEERARLEKLWIDRLKKKTFVRYF